MISALTLTPSSPASYFPDQTLCRDWPWAVATTAPLTIFCDFDGPLMDVCQRYYKTYQLALMETQTYFQTQGQALPLTALNLAEFWGMKQAKRPDRDIATQSGLVGEHIDFFLDQVQVCVNQPLFLGEDRLQPGVRSALQQLVNLGARLAVITLRCQTQVVQILQQHQLSHFFSLICGTQDALAAYENYAVCKQALLQEAIQAMGLHQDQALWMIGDTEADVLAAQAMQIKTIALTCGMRDYPFLQRLQPTSIQTDLTAATQFLTKMAVAL
ncbi:MAG: HAD family hydrolase [Acaryochloris sp. RU_4_1]|nr:HAD family hydrolase [Acaryochloris sp. RU_4_1]NJR56897.1 HAD family hydrolase [Acaryochloris sp. CRU_2_0]